MVQLCSARVVARLSVLVVLFVAATGSLLVLPLAPAQASFSSVVLNEAARHAGKPYQYGATGPNAFDCSGFTGYVYGRLGVPLPRTSRDQYAALPKVAQGDKQLGDLVFTYNSVGTIYHVGIYAGNNQMWAAPKTGDYVRLQTIWTSSHKVARPVSSAIQRHWINHGGKPGFLGAPTTGEWRTPDGSGAFNHYLGGSVYWSPATGAREVHGAIRGRWAAMGWERSTLGYPVSDEYSIPGGRRSDFQRGSIVWDASTGATTVR